MSKVEKKKLLIYAHYYIPDTASTGQILRELAEGMLDKFDVTVICVVPSYLGTVEDEYKMQKFYRENVIALETGISKGMGYGDNVKAALITRGRTELERLGGRIGCSPKTFSGLTGMGDLIVTCISEHSKIINVVS